MADFNDNVEEELYQRQQEEFEQQQQEERLARLQEEEEAKKNSAANQVKDAAIQVGKKIAKDFAKEEAAAAASAAWGAVVSTAPVWGPILGIILLVVGLGMFVIFSLVSICNAGGVTGFGATVLSKLGQFTTGGVDVCSLLKTNVATTQYPSGGAGASGSFAGLDIVVTSAYRPGAIVAGTTRFSAHSRGEAVDIALRPTVPIGSTDPRIAQLVALAKNVGFTPARGDTLDEYTNPTEGATGGHVHIEFNIYSNGTKTYCDDTTVKNPPTDLVALNVPTSGSLDPRVRPCMLAAVDQLFNLAAQANLQPQPAPAP